MSPSLVAAPSLIGLKYVLRSLHCMGGFLVLGVGWTLCILFLLGLLLLAYVLGTSWSSCLTVFVPIIFFLTSVCVSSGWFSFLFFWESVWVSGGLHDLLWFGYFAWLRYIAWFLVVFWFCCWFGGCVLLCCHLCLLWFFIAKLARKRS